MTSAVELSTFVGSVTRCSANASLAGLEAELLTAYSARAPARSDEGPVRGFSEFSVDKKLQICNDETEAAVARIAQVRARKCPWSKLSCTPLLLIGVILRHQPSAP